METEKQKRRTETHESHVIQERNENRSTRGAAGCRGTGIGKPRLTPELWFETARDFPPEEFVRGALGFTADNVVGEFPTPLFVFTRLILSHPELSNHAVGAAWGVVLAAVEQEDDFWAGLGVSPDDAEAEFYDMWERVKVPIGQTIMGAAIARANGKRLSVEEDLMCRRPERYEFFLTVAAWLQTIQGDEPIVIPCHSGELQAAMNCNEKTIWRYRNFAIKDGFMRKVKSGRGFRQGRDAADQFQFDLSRFEGQAA